MNLNFYSIVLVCLLISGCVPQAAHYHPKNYKSYVSSSSTNKSYVSATPTNTELLTAFEEVKSIEKTKVHNTFFVSGWEIPRGATSGLTLKDNESRKRLNDALNSTPLGGEAKWNKGGVSFILSPNSGIYNAYKSGGVCRDAVLVIYDETSEEVTRGLFCKTGIVSDWLRL